MLCLFPISAAHTDKDCDLSSLGIFEELTHDSELTHDVFDVHRRADKEQQFGAFAGSDKAPPSIGWNDRFGLSGVAACFDLHLLSRRGLFFLSHVQREA